MIDNHETMNLLLEAAEEAIEASIDSCNSVMSFEMSNKLPEPQTNIDDNIIEAPEKIANIVQGLRKLQELKQILQDKEQSLQDNVKDYMGLRTTLTLNNKPTISWKNCTRSSFDLPEFKAEYPELYGLFLKETTSRVFRLN